MAIDADALERVKEILDQALQLDLAERSAFVDQACHGDQDLRREVESLLRQEPLQTEGIEEPVFSLVSEDSATGERGGLAPGERIGAYRVVRQLGAGGMGAVALAVRQDDFEKRVALKLILPGIVSGNLVRRFHDERRILAQLDHPNIARILDGGTSSDGRPYFVMEYVEGDPIDEYCARAGLTVRERLELVRGVCSALRAAHQNLVVHRDLKPSNILITEEGRPKLLDFGIAKRLVPETGAQLTGLDLLPMTLKYASPEQIEGRTITTASDVYSLGVLLYELLTGRSPYRDEGTSAQALARTICEEEPLRPSVVAQHRAAAQPSEDPPGSPGPVSRGLPADDPRQLQRRLAGDLDSILLKALQKDPRARYSSVEELAEDLRRHLAGLPVTAREGTFAYVASKFIRRYTLQLAAAILLVLVVAFAASAGIQWRQADRERKLKNEFVTLIDLLFHDPVSEVSRGGGLESVQVLGRVEQKLDELQVEPPFKAEILESRSRIYLERGLFEDAMAPLERALKIRRQIHPWGGRTKLPRAINNLAGLYYQLGRYQQAEELYRETLAMKRQLGLGPEEVDIGKTLSNLATIRMSRNDFAEAETLFRRAIEVRKEVYGLDDPDVATSLRGLANVRYLQGDLEGAEALLREALRIRGAAFGPDHKKVASVLSTLGRVLHAQGRYREAEESYVRCLDIRCARLGEDHAHVALTRRDLAAVKVDVGDLATAEALLTQAFATLRETEDEGSWQLAEARSVQGALLAAQGRHAEAEPYLAESYRALAILRGEEAIQTRNALDRLLDLYRAWGKPDRAARYEPTATRGAFRGRRQ